MLNLEENNRQTYINTQWDENQFLNSNSILAKAQNYASTQHIDSALDLIYNTIETCLQAGSFRLVNEMFLEARPDWLNTHVILGLLTATLPARSKLSNWREFAIQSESVVKTRPEGKDDLFSHLMS